MDLPKIRTLRNLKELYKPEIAMLRQQGEDLSDDKRALRTLALFHLNSQLTNIIQEYFDTLGEDPEVFMGAMLQLAGVSGQLAGLCAKKDFLLATFALKKAKNHQSQEFLKHKER